MRRTSLCVTILLILAVALLAACGGSAAPTALPTAVASPAPTVLPTAEASPAPTVVPTTEVSLASPCAQPTSEALPSRLIVEEHPLSVGPSIRELGRTVGPGFGTYFETADGDTGQILAKNQALRDPHALLLASNNALLGPYGYRLELARCGDTGSAWYTLYQGDNMLFQGQVYALSPVSVNASGTDFFMQIEHPSGAYLLSQAGLDERDTALNGPVYVGDEPLTVAISETIRVRLGGRLAWEDPIMPSTFGSVTMESPWSFDGHWTIEETPGSMTEADVVGRVVGDGQDLNQTCGYEESFGFALLDGRPFHFFKRDGKIDIAYDGQQVPAGYDAIPHYQCCSAAALNPSTSTNMVWFYAKRGEQWYYVEAYVPLTETPAATICPTPTPVVVPTIEPLPTPPTLPGTPQAGATQTREADGMVLRYVPAGPFYMGSPEGVGEENEDPRHVVTLDAFWIDQTEVTNAQYQKCVEVRVCPTEGTDGFDPQGRPEYPVRVIWSGAEAYCRWAGGRLPIEAEWEKAARGTDGRIYPWGDDWPDCSRANHDSLHQGFCYDGLAPVGSFPAGASPYGVLDMAGNAEEWANDWYDADYYATSPQQNPLGPESGEFRVARGNSWYYPAEYIRAAYREGYTPNDTALGFRCVVPTTGTP